MIKWFGRTLILIVAALILSGIAYGLVQSSGETTGVAAFDGRGEYRPTEGSTHEEGEPRPERGDLPVGARGGREGFNLNGFDRVLRPLIIIAAVVVVVAPLLSPLKKRSRRIPASTAGS